MYRLVNLKTLDIWRLFECFKIPTRLTRGNSHFLRQLTPTHRTKHFIHACSTDPALACGKTWTSSDLFSWVLFHSTSVLRTFGLLLIESRSAPLIIGKSFPCPLPWWKCCYPWCNSCYTPLVADWSTIAGSHERSVLPRHAGRCGYGSRYKVTKKSMSSQ